MGSNPENRGPMLENLKRVRGKDAKRKAEQDEVVQRPTKAQCEREDRMAEVQLKAYWACFPLPDTPNVTERMPTGTHEHQRQVGKQAEATGSRKDFNKALRTSIAEKVEVDAKRRKCHQAELDPTNSGKDQSVLNRDRKVELTEDDLHQAGIQKWELRSITNLLNARKR